MVSEYEMLEEIKELRKLSGKSLMECKKTLYSTQGNFEEAKNILKRASCVFKFKNTEPIKEGESEMEKILKKIVKENEIKEEEVKTLPEAEPKVINFEVGINGIPKLNVSCDREMSIRDVAVALGTIDVLNFNNYLSKDKSNPKEAVRNYISFQTLKKQVFIEAVAKLLPDEKEILEILAEF